MTSLTTRAKQKKSEAQARRAPDQLHAHHVTIFKIKYPEVYSVNNKHPVYIDNTNTIALIIMLCTCISMYIQYTDY